MAPDKRRKRKTKRRVIESDRESGSEVGSEIESDHPSETSSVDRAAARSMRAARRQETIEAAEEKQQEKLNSQPESPVLAELDLVTLGSLGESWLSGIDGARLRSGNLKGELSDQIRRFVIKTRGLVNELVARLDDRGDASYLRGQVTELTANLKALKCSEEARTRELDALRREVDILRSRMQPDTRVVGIPEKNTMSDVQRRDLPVDGCGTRDSTSINPKLVLDRLSSSSPLPQRRPDPRSARKVQTSSESTRLQGKPTDISNKAPVDLLSVSEVDDASIDEVIYNLIELRNLRRPHLPPLSQPLRNNLTVIPPPDPSIPPKRGRGRPRITRNEQIAPPKRPLVVTPGVSSDVEGVSTPQPITDANSGWVSAGRRRRARRGKTSKNPPLSHAGSSIGGIGSCSHKDRPSSGKTKAPQDGCGDYHRFW